MSEMDYDEFVIRNKGLISEEVQQKIGKTRILICGAGMGSIIAELAVRTGFRFLVIVDNDTVALSNLNRQIYTFSDAENQRKKTLALIDRLLRINPLAKIEAITEFITSDGLPEIINTVDIVIDCIDISEAKAFLAIHKQANQFRKILFSPFNLANSSALMVFDKNTISLEKMIGFEEGNKSFNEIMSIWLNFCFSNQEKFTEAFLQFMKKYAERIKQEGWCPLPQLGVTTYLTASLTLSVIIRYLAGEKIKKAPDFYIMTL